MQSLPDQVLSVAVAALEGVQPTAEVAEPLLARLEASHQKFLNQAVGNPETDADMVSSVLQAFTQCEDGLRRMMLETGTDAAAIVHDAASRLRNEQKLYVSSIRNMGPTPFPDPNRVLFHLRLLRDGHPETRYGLLALADLAGIEARTLADLDDRESRCIFSEARPQATAAARAIAELARNASASLEQWADLDKADRRAAIDAVEGRLEHQCTRLAEALGRYAAAEISSGPTANPTVNMVLLSAHNVESGLTDLDDLAEVLQQLEESMPLDSTLHDPVVQLLEATMTGDTEAMAEYLAHLRTLGESVGSDGKQLDEDDEIVFDFIQSSDGLHVPSGPTVVLLPRNLQAAVEAVEDYLDRPAFGPDAAHRMVEALATRMTATRAMLARPRTSAEDVKVVTAGLTVMEEALEALRDAVSALSRPALASARESLAQASDILSGIATRKKR